MTKLTIKELVAHANEVVETLSASNALDSQSCNDAILIDIRDIRELGREGRIENAIHVPRGMLEFWFDPESPYHKEHLTEEDKTYVLYCAAAWRSALSCSSEECGWCEEKATTLASADQILKAIETVTPL